MKWIYVTVNALLLNKKHLRKRYNINNKVIFDPFSNQKRSVFAFLWISLC